jgi:soluble lytic murein transglycosylase-like protein
LGVHVPLRTASRLLGGFFLCSVLIAPWLTTRAADVYVSYAADGTPTFATQAYDASFVLLIKGPTQASSVKSVLSKHDNMDIGKRRAALDPLLRQAADKHGVDPALMRAIAHVESGFNTRAVSPAGAAGIMQLMPATALRYGALDRSDPAQNLDAGAHYVKDLLALYAGNVALALAAYNSGERNVERHARNMPPFRETMLYVPEVLTRYESYRQAELSTPQQ